MCRMPQALIRLAVACALALTCGVGAAATPFSVDLCLIPKLLGNAGLFNLYVYDSVRHHESDTDGRIAIGGGASGSGASTLRNYRVGAMLPTGNRLTLLVNGPLAFNDGKVDPANVIYGRNKPAIDGSVFVSGQVLPAPSSFGVTQFFQQTQVELERAAKDLAALPGLEVTTATASVSLVGTNSARNVFRVGPNVLRPGSVTNEFRIHAPAGSLVVVNVAGSAVAMTGFNFRLSGGVQPETILFNFHEAQTVELSDVGIQGTVLAPFANVAFTNGVVKGNLLARSFHGRQLQSGNYEPNDGQLNDLFAQCVDDGQVSALLRKLGF